MQRKKKATREAHHRGVGPDSRPYRTGCLFPFADVSRLLAPDMRSPTKLIMLPLPPCARLQRLNPETSCHLSNFVTHGAGEYSQVIPGCL